MRTRNIALILILSILLFACTGCDVGTTIPYSSDEYENGEWSVEELVEHFEELGFTDIEIEEKTTFDESKERIQVVVADDSDSWFSSYRDFEKGETISTIRKIIIRATTLTPVLTVENSPEFADFAKNGLDSENNTIAWTTFLEEHNGEALEFDGIITNWYDEFWYISGVDCTIAVEGNENMSLYWSVENLDDLGLTGEYSQNEYSQGRINEDMQVHVLAVIDYSKDDGLKLEIESMQIIE